MSNVDGLRIIENETTSSRVDLALKEKTINGFDTFMTYRQFSSDFNSLMDNLFSKHSMSFGRFNILLELEKSAQGLMPSELAERCKVTQATISGLLNGLEKNQIIFRQAHQNDGRAYVIKLTEKGQKLFEEIRPEFFNKIEQIFKSLENSEITQFNSMLLKLCTEVQRNYQM